MITLSLALRPKISGEYLYCVMDEIYQKQSLGHFKYQIFQTIMISLNFNLYLERRIQERSTFLQLWQEVQQTILQMLHDMCRCRYSDPPTTMT
jgi:aspartate/tyrosine/aromatic aminotransferase